MVTVTIAVLTIFFAIGSVSPLLVTDQVEHVVELERIPAEGEC